MTSHSPLFTVVVPTFRRPDLLRRCLTALEAQTLPTTQFEIVVVDDGNDPDTATVVGAFANSSGIQTTYLGQPQQRGPATARNRGWRVAKGTIIAFTDDDCLPDPNWLRAASISFESEATVVTGRVVMPLPDQPTSHDRTTALLETAEFVTANCFCLRSALEAVGGFDEEFDMAWREDSELQFRFLETGIPIVRCPEAVVVHPLRPAPWYASLKDERKNRYDALLYKRHPRLFRERIPQYRGLVSAYYGAVGGALLAVGGALVGNKPVAKAGSAGWLLVTAGLAIHRQAAETPRQLPKTLATVVVSPFLSVYWRLYGAVKHRVWYV